MDRVDAVCPHLCRRHHSITSPAEVWELPPVEAEANWSGIRRDSVLDLEFELVEGGKVEIWSWPAKQKTVNSRGGCWEIQHFLQFDVSLAAPTSNHVVPTPALSRCPVTGHVHSATYVTLTV